MSQSTTKRGYCPICVKNIPHFRAFNSRFFYALDYFSFGIAGAFRVGPWHCKHCLHRTIFLKRELRTAANYRVDDPGTISSAGSTDPAQDPKVAQPIGNLLKSEKSLVMRSKRLKRFSEKYRDSIVRRLLSGTGTMMQIREEKNISEGELVDWISDLFERMQVRITLLEQSTDASTLKRLHSEQSGESVVDSIPSGPTVEGQVRSR